MRKRQSLKLIRKGLRESRGKLHMYREYVDFNKDGGLLLSVWGGMMTVNECVGRPRKVLHYMRRYPGRMGVDSWLVGSG